MILGIGTDIVFIPRIEGVLHRRPRFADRILTKKEFELFQSHQNPAAYLAKRFAAKEAISKALGCGIGTHMGWKDVEIGRDSLGRPEVSFTGVAQDRLSKKGAIVCHLSISDEADYALAFAVIS